MSYLPTRRIILDGPPEDYERCLRYAREAIRSGDVGDVWGCWSSEDPNFQAVVRVNKGSVSVKAVRKDPRP